ncbi:hypothetical protein IU414_27190 [Nocardia farcinica]|uniref:hypothetical protein n=1 Tax=Nocardia TaxID=1817 RepID=UPI0003119731|nr:MULTISPECIES: hypothetical protein [Nocardia]MBF6588432.1 hypothetical protein [Nocardia farcinica]
MTVANVHLTERDTQVLGWLREVGVASSSALRAAYGHFGGEELDQRLFSRRVIKLENAGVIGSAFLSHGRQHKVYWPAERPYRLARRELAHDLLVAEFSLWLASGRRSGITLLDHPAAGGGALAVTADKPLATAAALADLMVWFPDDTVGLVELELTPKSGRKLKTVLDSHAARLRGPEQVAWILYLTTKRAGRVVAEAWRQLGHEADHPERLWVLHAVDDARLVRLDLSELSEIKPRGTTAGTPS